MKACTSSRLNAAILPVVTLAAADREAMWTLFARFYDGSSRSLFHADLADKDYVLLLRDESGTLRGFSTIAVWEREIEGTPLRVVYSGDTIMEREYWGSQALAFNWLRFAGSLKRMAPEVPLYWFLIVKGQRTYRYLPAFALEFIPHWRSPDPPHLGRLRDALATGKFGAAYDPSTGVVRFQESRGHLAREWATVSARESMREDVRFFVSRNAGYARGDELVCLCELAESNLRPLARRVFTAEDGVSESLE